MEYLYRKKIQKNVAAFLVLVMLAETLLPAGALASMYVPRRSAGHTLPPPFSPLFMAGSPLFGETAVKRQTTAPLSSAREVKHPDRQANRLQGAMTAGPGQPEMSSFKSVNADNTVDLFTGDFSYNIPLLDVGGYPVNIYYQGATQ